jgi:antitoxin component YwqK of YwqJK toxin-antitoxin module
MRTFVVLIISWTLMLSCQNNSTSTASPSTEGTASDNSWTGQYEFEAIAGTDSEMATLYAPNGDILEQGPVLNDKKNGTWSYFEEKSEFPMKVISFVDDKYNGAYLEFNDRGQAELMATYKNNKLHGAWGKFRFGRPEITADYVDGELDGIMREYDYRSGKLKKEASYKAGQLDGLVRDYDEQGQVMVEYMYREGEKISGGIVEREE